MNFFKGDLVSNWITAIIQQKTMQLLKFILDVTEIRLSFKKIFFADFDFYKNKMILS